MILHAPLSPLHRQTVAPAVKMPIIATFHAISLQKSDDLGTPVALIERRIVEETELLPLPSCL